MVDQYAKTRQNQVTTAAQRDSETLGPRNNGPEQSFAAQAGWDGTAEIDERMWADAAAETIKRSVPGQSSARGSADNLGSKEMWEKASSS